MNKQILQIGPIVLEIRCKNRALNQKIKELCAAFIVQAKAEYVIKVCVNDSVVCLEQVLINYQHDVYAVSSQEWVLSLNTKTKIAKLVILPEYAFESFSNAIKHIISFLVLTRKGLVFHACAIARDQKAYIFCGPSGSGKSTIAKLSEKYTVLSEEVVGVLDSKAFAIPYAGDVRFFNRSNQMYEIAGFFWLIKALDNSCERIPLSQASAIFLSLPDGYQKIFDTGDFIERCYKTLKNSGAYSLSFKPDITLWESVLEASKGVVYA